MADVGVTLYDERDSDGYLDTVSTDSSGNFTFERLGEGTYYLRFSPDARNNTENYLPEYYNDQRLLSEAAGIDVAQDTNAVANASLSIGGQITGTVVALESGLPLDVSLRLYDSEDNRVASANTYRNNGVFELMAYRLANIAFM